MSSRIGPNSPPTGQGETDGTPAKRNNFGNRMTVVLRESNKNFEKGMTGVAMGAFKAALGASTTVGGTIAVFASSYFKTGVGCIILGLALVAIGLLQVAVESLRAGASALQAFTSPVTALNPHSIDPKRHQMRFKGEKEG